jgi:rhodanese-related sulfurtransferase
MTQIKTISAQDFGNIKEGEGLVLDVRTPEEHTEKRLAVGHVHIPLDQLDGKAFVKEHVSGSSQPVYILCRGGKRAAVAAEKIAASGYQHVFVIEGGLLACEAGNHAVEGTAAGA